MECTCHDTTRHRIASRRTSDGLAIILWSDGTITGNLGAIDGLPVTSPRSDKARSIALRAGWLLIGEVELYERAELRRLHEACRWTAERDGQPGTVRARFHRAPRLRPVWRISETDRDGNPVERYWRLPRLRWPGLVVWNRPSAQFPYEVWLVDHHDTCQTTGCRFRTLEELSRYLSRN